MYSNNPITPEVWLLMSLNKIGYTALLFLLMSFHTCQLYSTPLTTNFLNVRHAVIQSPAARPQFSWQQNMTYKEQLWRLLIPACCATHFHRVMNGRNMLGRIWNSLGRVKRDLVTIWSQAS